MGCGYTTSSLPCILSGLYFFQRQYLKQKKQSYQELWFFHTSHCCFHFTFFFISQFSETFHRRRLKAKLSALQGINVHVLCDKCFHSRNKCKQVFTPHKRFFYSYSIPERPRVVYRFSYTQYYAGWFIYLPSALSVFMSPPLRFRLKLCIHFMFFYLCHPPINDFVN